MALNRKTATSLAVTYAAFVEAINKGDKESIHVWALLLHEAQEATGIELLTNVLQHRIQKGSI